MKILVTGSAGFIGFHLSKLLLSNRFEVMGLDNVNSYYSIKLKEARLSILNRDKNFKFVKVDIKDKKDLFSIFEKFKPDYVVNLAAQAGVRYSIENPDAYVDSNLVGFVNLLEACKSYPVKHFIYASSSSVYGGNTKVPFSTNHTVDHPVSLYAATKKSNELIAHAYSHLYKIPTTGLRFFTVYGPWGRPDMAYFTFTKDILEGNPIKLFNYGNMERDFTYIDDVVAAILAVLYKIPIANESWEESADNLSTSFAPYKIYNIGNNKPITLINFINILESILGKEANKEYVDMQPGDVYKTYADISDLDKDIGFKPSMNIEDGLLRFVNWYKEWRNE